MDKKEKYAVFAANFNSEVIVLRDSQEDESESVNYKKGNIGILSFLNYSGTISANGGEESEEWPFGITFKDDNSYVLLWDMADFSLLKKPLEYISDEDIKYIEQEILGDISWNEINKALLKWPYNLGGSCEYIHGILPHDWLRIFDVLRERGYALPYKNWSVEQLVEFGIYKLIDQ